MSVLLSSKNGFELPTATGGESSPTVTDQLAEFTAGGLSISKSSPNHHRLSPPLMATGRPLQEPNSSRSQPVHSSAHSLAHPDQLIHQSSHMDIQITPTDSGGEQTSNGSRSCSPSDHQRPAQLAAIANELLDQLNNLNRCTSPTFNKNRISPSLSDRSGHKNHLLGNKSPPQNLTTSHTPCATVSLCNGQLQTQHSPLTTLSPPPPSAQSPINSMNASSLCRLYHITHTQSMLHGGPLLQAFAQMRRQDMLLDCTLVCEQQMLRAHKLLLAACSPYFRTIFSSMAGCNNSAVVIPDVPVLDLHCLLRIVYGGLRGQLRLSDRRLLSIWRSARRLRMRNVCEFLLRNQMLLSNAGDRFDQLDEQHLDQLQVHPAGAIADSSLEEQNETVDADEDMDLMQQLVRLDQNEQLLDSSLIVDQSSLQQQAHSPSSDNRFAQLDEMTSGSKMNCSSSGNHLPTSNNSATNDPTQSNDQELNMISAIAVLSQAAAAAAAANSGNSSNRRRFGVTDLPSAGRNVDNQSSLDFMNSLTKDVEMSENVCPDAELLRRMQQALASPVNMKQNGGNKSTAENLFSQLTSGNLSPTTSALLLGLDLHQQQTQQSHNTQQHQQHQQQHQQHQQQQSPGSNNELNSNSTASQLMAVAQQQLFGQLSGLAAGFNAGANALQSNAMANAAGLPVKRGRGRPPRHTQPRDLDDEPIQLGNNKDRLPSPPQPDGGDLSGPKRWRANIETILALKSRNKLNSSLNAGHLGLMNANNHSGNNSGNVSKPLLNPSMNQFDRLTGGLTSLPPCSQSGNHLLMNGSSVLNGNSMKSIGCKMANDRNGGSNSGGGGGPDNKNVCPFCPQVYYSNQAMNDHINNVHTKNSTKYTCEFCSKEFSWKISLTKHLKNCHNNTSNDALNPATSSCPAGLNLTSGQTLQSHSNPTAINPTSAVFAHQQLGKQLAHQNLMQTSPTGQSNGGLTAQQLLNNGELFKNLMGQREHPNDLVSMNYDC